VDNYGSTNHVPIFDTLYLGGPNSLRGFRFRAMAPHDNKGQPIGGDSLARMTASTPSHHGPRARGRLLRHWFCEPGAFDMSVSKMGSDVGLGLRLDCR